MVRDKRQYGWFELVDVKFRVPLVAILSFYIIIILVIAFFAGYFFYLYFSESSPHGINQHNNTGSWKHYDLPNCSNMTLVNTSKCLNDFVRDVYNYQETDDDINLSYDQLFNEGGDCKNWNIDFYKIQLDNYGFDTTEEEIFVKDEIEDGVTYHIFHTFVIVSDSTGYCLLDLESITCAIYINDSGGKDEK